MLTEINTTIKETRRENGKGENEKREKRRKESYKRKIKLKFSTE